MKKQVKILAAMLAVILLVTGCFKPREQPEPYNRLDPIGGLRDGILESKNQKVITKNKDFYLKDSGREQIYLKSIDYYGKQATFQYVTKQTINSEGVHEEPQYFLYVIHGTLKEDETLSDAMLEVSLLIHDDIVEAYGEAKSSYALDPDAPDDENMTDLERTYGQAVNMGRLEYSWENDGSFCNLSVSYIESFYTIYTIWVGFYSDPDKKPQ
ncbi:MAG: hypothetical protein ACOX88_04365 [Christensenellales bacterium]|jgi:hypothetical protein